MLIDWFTVIAQAINFLVLMCLLKRFLYKPILNAIDAREARIVETVKDAETQKEAARAERDLFARKNDDLERRREEFMNRAREDARAEGERLLERERRTVASMREKWRSDLADEQARFGDETARRIQDEIFAIARQAFSDLADTSLEERMVKVFDSRLRQAWEAPDDSLAAALRAAPAGVRVKSAFDLSEDRRESLRRTFSETFAPGGNVTFETDPELIGGIELIVDGRKAVWTIADYLDELKTGVFSVHSPSPAPAATGNAATESVVRVSRAGSPGNA